MKSTILTFFLSLILCAPSFAESAYQGNGAAGTAGALNSGAINGPSGHESGPPSKDLGNNGNGVGGMGTGTSGDRANGTKSDAKISPKHSAHRGNPGNPSSDPKKTKIDTQ